MSPQQGSAAWSVKEDILYSIVALDLSIKELAEIIKSATGVAVDPDQNTVTGLLQSLHQSQLVATWNWLSKDSRWRRPEHIY